jgi:hypothetical protein
MTYGDINLKRRLMLTISTWHFEGLFLPSMTAVPPRQSLPTGPCLSDDHRVVTLGSTFNPMMEYLFRVEDSDVYDALAWWDVSQVSCITISFINLLCIATLHHLPCACFSC